MKCTASVSVYRQCEQQTQLTQQAQQARGENGSNTPPTYTHTRAPTHPRRSAGENGAAALTRALAGTSIVGDMWDQMYKVALDPTAIGGEAYR